MWLIFFRFYFIVYTHKYTLYDVYCILCYIYIYSVIYVYCILMRFVVAIKSVCTRRTSSMLEENRNIITFFYNTSYAFIVRGLAVVFDFNLEYYDSRRKRRVSRKARNQLYRNIYYYTLCYCILLYCYITPRKWFQVHKNILSWRVYDRLKYVPRSDWTFSAMFLWKTITPLNLF